jgi:hypothetical protein
MVASVVSARTANSRNWWLWQINNFFLFKRIHKEYSGCNRWFPLLMVQGGCIYLLRLESANDFINVLFTQARFGFSPFRNVGWSINKAVGSLFSRPKYKSGYSFRKKYWQAYQSHRGNSSLY